MLHIENPFCWGFSVLNEAVRLQVLGMQPGFLYSPDRLPI